MKAPAKNLTWVYLTVFATGLFSLVYQIAWQRYLTFLVGADSRSSVLTLTVFLTALSLGYWLAGVFSEKIKSKEILFYGGVEILIGLWALLFSFLFHSSLSWVQGGLFVGFFGDLILVILLTGIPATLMGTTLPFLTQGLSRSFQSSSKTHARVYAVNTFGACLGTLLAGFYLLEGIGLKNSLFITGGMNVGFGVFMWWYGRQWKLSEASNDSVSETAPFRIRLLPLLIVAACSGYLLIAMESYFIRLYSLATDGSIHAYPAIVTAFIAAVGVGAALSGQFMQRAHQLFHWVPWITLLGWVLVYLTIPYWPYADYVLKHKVMHWFDSYDYLPMARFVLVFCVISVPVIASSTLLPFSFHFFKSQSRSIGRTTGDLYAVATTATVLGGIVGGYLVFRWLSFANVFYSYLVILAVMVLASSFVIKKTVTLRFAPVILSIPLFVWVLLTPSKDFDRNLALTFYFQTPTAKDSPVTGLESAHQWLWNWFDYKTLLRVVSEPEGFVAVLDNDNEKRMVTINGRSNSGTVGTDYQGNALLSLFPYLMTENPRNILVIGVGTGVTVGAIAAQENIQQVDVSEINPAVTEVVDAFDFAAFDVSKNPKVRWIHADAVKHLLRNEQSYDIIVSIPSNFWVAGVENLMTPEFYNLAKNRLNPGGTYIQWIPDYEFSTNALKIMVRSFTTAFENSSLWRLTQDDLVLMYQKGEVNQTRPWLQQRLAEDSLIQVTDRIDYLNPRRLTYSMLANDEVLLSLSEDAKLHSLDRPQLGATVLKSLYSPESGYSAEKLINEIKFNKKR